LKHRCKAAPRCVATPSPVRSINSWSLRSFSAACGPNECANCTPAPPHRLSTVFHCAPEPCACSSAACLSARNGRGIVFAPYAQDEADPGWDGNYEFIDPETSLPHEHRVESALLQRYESAYKRHFELWKAAALKHGIAMARVSAAVDFQKALQHEGIASGGVESA
jgi:hypothetical protein